VRERRGLGHGPSVALWKGKARSANRRGGSRPAAGRRRS
jgi:hypothetical protein